MRTYLRIRRRFPKIRCVLPGGAAPPLPELCVCKKNALSFHTQGEEDLRGTTCVPGKPGAQISVTGGPGGAYCAFSPAARRRRELRLCGSLHQPLPLCGAARSSFLFSACYRYGKLMRYTSSMMGEGLACCGLTRARNLLRDSRISLRACAMASSVRFMESST